VNVRFLATACTTGLDVTTVLGLATASVLDLGVALRVEDVVAALRVEVFFATATAALRLAGAFVETFVVL